MSGCRADGTPMPCFAFVELDGMVSLWAQLVRVPWAQVALRWGDTWHPALVCTSHGFVFQLARICSSVTSFILLYDERTERRWSQRH